MEAIIKDGKDYRIIPATIEHSTTLDVINVENSLLEAKLNFLTEAEISSYKIGEEAEVFGSTDEGLVYFRARINSVENNIIKLAIPTDFTKVQRREYSRIDFGSSAKLLTENLDIKTVDISAGGIKFISENNLIIGKDYDFSFVLDNDKEIVCKVQPMRSYQTSGVKGFVVCARFADIKSSDKVAIVQYSFRKIMELENSLNDW